MQFKLTFWVKITFWAVGCNRYEIQRILVDKHIDELIQIKPIRQELTGELRQVIVKLISNRLDLETRKAYEIQLKADDLPKWNELLQILLQRCRTLESIERRNTGAPLKVTSSTPTSSY
jgi:BMFP domain-containing protein YqiC